MSILHIDSSARREASNTRVLSRYLVEQLVQQHTQAVQYRDLGHQPLPPISADDLISLHGGQHNDKPSFQQQLAVSDELIEELKQANTLVLAAPMYNFSVPAVVRQWIDSVYRAGISFKYTEQGPEGLLNIDKAYIITATGGTPVGSSMDFASPYLDFICRFIGVKEVSIINAAGSKNSREELLISSKQSIDDLLQATTTTPA